jgi:tRNA pseudouridine55 synthase
MARRPRRPVHGWLILDKPLGLSSTQAVGKIRWLFNAEKAGHGGTLDPLATGLLPIALGEATKTVPFAMEGEKTYRFTVKWGAETATCDLEGTVTATSAQRPSPSDIEAILPRFVGRIDQTPPAYSAMKVAGKRAYDLARAGEEVVLAPRPVTIHRLSLLGQEGDEARFEVDCGKGTYVRSLARDLGRALGCLGHVTALRRIRVGAFSENHMISLEKLEEMSHKPPGDNAMERALVPIATVLDGIPALALMGEEGKRLRQGQEVLLTGSDQTADTVLILCEGKPLGLASMDGGRVIPRRLFNL